MKLSLSLKLAAIATTVLAGMFSLSPTEASVFGEQEVEENQIIAVAAPFGYDQYNLVIVEQIPEGKQCWSETATTPVTVEPLLLDFDFTGHCRRSTDTNGYSIRIDDQDYGLDYLLRIVERDGELQLIGTSRTDSSQPEIIIGRTYGLKPGFLKIFLNPGWNFSKRTFEDKTLGHVYLSGNQEAIAASQDSIVGNSDSGESSTPSLTPSSTENLTETSTPSSIGILTPSSNPSSTESLTPSLTPSSTENLTEISTPSSIESLTPSLTPSSTENLTEISTPSSIESSTPSSTSSSTGNLTEISTPSSSKNLTDRMSN
ncbi:MAG: DUF3747 domain-containing protein [Prochloraceae cyanobacterium]